MKHNTLLTGASLLTVLFATLHLAGDIMHGYERGGRAHLIAIPICVLWLYGTLMLGERRSGHMIILLGSLLVLVVPYVHMGGAGLGVARSSGAFFFIWTIFALGVTALFSVILSVQGLWDLRRGRSDLCAAETGL